MNFTNLKKSGKLNKKISIAARDAQSFNDKSTSNFIVESKGEEFCVHEYILRKQSDHFDRILSHENTETRKRKIVIDDFEPEVVKILLSRNNF